MTLENPNFIDDFNTSAPTFQDFKAEGDDHIRNIKKAIKATFPGLNGKAWRKRSVSATGSLGQTDNMALIRATTTLTLTPAAAASLGNGWMAILHAAGGNITVDPTGGEKVNGAATMQVPNGYMGMLFCDGTEFFMFLVYSDQIPTVKPFATGTRMVFQQTSAPIGWTKVTSGSYNDAALRFTTGTVGVGGSDGFVGTFGSGKSTGGHTITWDQTAGHQHTGAISLQTGASGALSVGGTPRGTGQGADSSSGFTTNSAGGGQSHAHSIPAMNVRYVDCIVASID